MKIESYRLQTDVQGLSQKCKNEEAAKDKFSTRT